MSRLQIERFVVWLGTGDNGFIILLPPCAVLLTIVVISLLGGGTP